MQGRRQFVIMPAKFNDKAVEIIMLWFKNLMVYRLSREISLRAEEMEQMLFHVRDPQNNKSYNNTRQDLFNFHFASYSPPIAINARMAALSSSDSTISFLGSLTVGFSTFGITGFSFLGFGVELFFSTS